MDRDSIATMDHSPFYKLRIGKRNSKIKFTNKKQIYYQLLQQKLQDFRIFYSYNESNLVCTHHHKSLAPKIRIKRQDKNTENANSLNIENL